MTGKIIVTAAGLLLLLAVNVYFLRPGRGKKPRP
jgi:hypothetical protein